MTTTKQWFVTCVVMALLSELVACVYCTWLLGVRSCLMNGKLSSYHNSSNSCSWVDRHARGCKWSWKVHWTSRLTCCLRALDMFSRESCHDPLEVSFKIKLICGKLGAIQWTCIGKCHFISLSDKVGNSVQGQCVNTLLCSLYFLECVTIKVKIYC